MAHPHKRRKLEKHPDLDYDQPIGPNAHGAQEVEALSLQSLRTPPSIDEIHVRIRSEQASKHKQAAHHALHRRQFASVTAAASDTTATITSMSSALASASSAATNTTGTLAASTTAATNLISSIPSVSANGTTVSSTLLGSNSTVILSVASAASAVSGNATAATVAHSSATAFGNSTASHTTLGLFVTTLSDGLVETLTSSSATATSGSSTINGLLSTTTGSATNTGDSTATATNTATNTAIEASGTGSSSTSSSAAAGSTGSVSSDSSSSTPPASIIAGGVVGGVAGIAVIALIALLFLRWYRRKSGQQLLRDHPEGEAAASSSGTGPSNPPGMAQRAGLLPLATAAAAMFGRRDTPEPSNERSFQRLSGRKLPSAFSAGITAPPDAYQRPRPVPMPAAFGSGSDGSNASRSHEGESSYLRDSTVSGGRAESDTSQHSHDAYHQGPVELRPGPSRQPTLHPGGPYHVSENPFSDPPGATSRSATPIDFGRDYIRGGRFVEDV